MIFAQASKFTFAAVFATVLNNNYLLNSNLAQAAVISNVNESETPVNDINTDSNADVVKGKVNLIDVGSLNRDRREDTNEFIFYWADALTVVEVSHDIASGEAYDGIKAKSKNTIEVLADRKGSSSVASSFKSGLSSNNMLGTITNVDGAESLPGSLNFYVLTNLTLTLKNTEYFFPDFRIGQGHCKNCICNGSTSASCIDANNWWFGSESCSWVGDGYPFYNYYLKCVAESGKELYFEGSDSNVYEVKVSTSKP
eukprot:Pgem_evm1s2008